MGQNREAKTAGRAKARRFGQGNRAFVHNMVNRKAKENAEAIRRFEQRKGA